MSLTGLARPKEIQGSVKLEVSPHHVAVPVRPRATTAQGEPQINE